MLRHFYIYVLQLWISSKDCSWTWWRSYVDISYPKYQYWWKAIHLHICLSYLLFSFWYQVWLLKCFGSCALLALYLLEFCLFFSFCLCWHDHCRQQYGWKITNLPCSNRVSMLIFFLTLVTEEAFKIKFQDADVANWFLCPFLKWKATMFKIIL